MVQWLRVHASTAGGMGSIPGQGTKILHAAQCEKKRKKERERKKERREGRKKESKPFGVVVLEPTLKKQINKRKSLPVPIIEAVEWVWCPQVPLPSHCLFLLSFPNEH